MEPDSKSEKLNMNGTAGRKKVTLEFSDVCLQIKGKDVLKGVEGVAEPGQLLAVMGPSGAGKTLLLTCLAGRQSNFKSGRILLNGKQINKQLRRKISFVLQDDIFLDQLTLRDTLMFTAHLRLPSSMSYKEKLEKVLNVVDTLDLRKCLDTKIGNTFRRGLSGGEKKRANIGCELLTDPAILLLDEPTSGLDSHAASGLIDTLKKYASSSGKTIVTSIHQPSSHTFYRFDKLLLMSEGEVVYFGQANQVTNYFASLGLHCPLHYNPADFIIDKVKGSDAERTVVHSAAKTTTWIDLQNKNHKPDVHVISGDVIEDYGLGINGHCNQGFSVENITNGNLSESVFIQIPGEGAGKVGGGTIALPANANTNCSNNHHTIPHSQCSPPIKDAKDSYSIESEDDATDDVQKWPTGFWSQLFTLTHRNFKQNRGIILSKLELFRSIGISLIVGALWFQVPDSEESIRDQSGMIFFLSTYFGFMSIFGIITAFPAERSVTNKERLAGAYRLSSYFISKIIGDFPLDVAMLLLMVIIAYWMTGLNNSAVAFFSFAGTAVLYSQVGRGIGILVSALASSTQQAIVISSLSMLTCMLLAGFYIDALPSALYWVRYLSFTSHGYGALLSCVFILDPKHITCSPTMTSMYAECLAPNATNTTVISGTSIVGEAAGIFLPMWLYYVALVGFIVVFNTSAYLVLRFCKKPSS